MYIQESKFICSNFSNIYSSIYCLEFFSHVLIATYPLNVLFIKYWEFMLKFTF